MKSLPPPPPIDKNEGDTFPMIVEIPHILDFRWLSCLLELSAIAFDIFLIYGFLGRNFKWMMKKSLRKIPFVGKACESAGHIFVDRTSPKGMLSTIRQAERSLTNGVSLVVFPEGSRTQDGSLGSFKRGAFQLADDLQLPVVPVTINGSFDVLPRSAKWVRRHRLELTIHQPIPPQGKGPENVKALMTGTYEAVAGGLK